MHLDDKIRTAMRRASYFKNVYIFHGKGGNPDGTAGQLEQILSHAFPTTNFMCPRLPHSDPKVTADESLDWLQNQFVPFINPGSLVVGISMGGLVASKLQELYPALIDTFNLVTPTSADGVKLERRMYKRVALYSSTADPMIQGRCENWPELTHLAFDVPWLVHDVDLAKHACCYLISCYMRGHDMKQEVETLFPESPDPSGIYQDEPVS
jgi:pimeloyl-ACP methyl ester carboxylesterase